MTFDQVLVQKAQLNWPLTSILPEVSEFPKNFSRRRRKLKSLDVFYLIFEVIARSEDTGYKLVAGVE